jgi:hypothetical protein
VQDPLIPEVWNATDLMWPIFTYIYNLFTFVYKLLCFHLTLS